MLFLIVLLFWVFICNPGLQTIEILLAYKNNIMEILQFLSSVQVLSNHYAEIIRIQFSSVAQSCPTLCDPMNHSTPGLPVHHQLPEFTQTHVHWVFDAIQPSHPLSSPSPPAPNPSQHQSLPVSQLFAWGGQSTWVSALASGYMQIPCHLNIFGFWYLQGVLEPIPQMSRMDVPQNS